MPNTGDLPKYIQISELLIRDIQAGRLLDGERLPPERDMARSMGISVGTLRKALAVMTEKGLLQRLQGSGNYVRRKEDQQSIYAFLHLELTEGGGLPTAEILSVDTMVKPADLPEFGSSDRGHRIRRFRRLSGRPAAIEEIWLDGSYIDKLRADQLSESLYLFYGTSYRCGSCGRSILSASLRCQTGPFPNSPTPPASAWDSSNVSPPLRTAGPQNIRVRGLIPTPRAMWQDSNSTRHGTDNELRPDRRRHDGAGAYP